MTAETLIELDKPRPIRYTVRSLLLLESRSRRNLGELLVTNASLSSAVYLIWAGLVHDDKAFQERREPELTIDDVSELLQTHWFAKGRTIPELQPFYTEGLVESGMFARRDDPKKARPEAAPPPLAPTSGSLNGPIVSGLLRLGRWLSSLGSSTRSLLASFTT